MSNLVDEIAYWVPLTTIVWGLLWYIVRLRGAIRNDVAFSTNNFSTWPITLVLTNAVVYKRSCLGIVLRRRPRRI